MSDGFIAKFLNSEIMTKGGDAEPLDTKIDRIEDNIYIQTLLQNISTASIDWVFSSQSLGRVLNKAFNLNSPTLAELNTITQIVNSKPALTAITSSPSAVKSFESSPVAINAIKTSSLKINGAGSAGVSPAFTLNRAGKVFVISAYWTTVYANPLTMTMRYTIADDAIISPKLTTLSSSPGVINRFMTNIETSNLASSGAQYTSMSYTIVPCE